MRMRLYEAFVTWEEQRNNFTFDNHKETHVYEKSKEVVRSNKVVLPHTFWVLKIMTLSNYPSKLNLFQEIRLTLLSPLEAFFTKCD